MNIPASFAPTFTLSVLVGAFTPSDLPIKQQNNHAGSQLANSEALEFVEFKNLKLISQSPPSRYPSEAKARGIQGTVVVDFAINESGNVYSAKAITGPPELFAASEQNALGMRFHPYTREGTPVKVHSHLTNVWKLR